VLSTRVVVQPTGVAAPGTAVAVIIFERCGVTVERVSGQPFGTFESRRPFDVDLREGS
jgi:hypothetical protein